VHIFNYSNLKLEELAMNHLVKLISAICLTILFTATYLKAGEIHDAVDAGDLNKVKALLETDPNLLESKDNDGSTPLHIACLQNQVAVANFLIDKGANVNARDNWNHTPLHNANGVFGQDYELIKRLIAKGTDVNAQGNRGETPLEWSAADRGNVEVTRLLIDNGADINLCAKGAISILHRAIKNNQKETAKLLVERGAKLNLKDPSGRIEIHLAALYNAADLVRSLLEHGVDIEALDGHNRTALYYAAKHGYRKVADALIAAGAKKNAVIECNYDKAPQLSDTLEDGEAYLWYLGGFAGAGYAVKTKDHLLLIDPPGIDRLPEAGLANGHLNPDELSGQKITVLITKPEWERYRLDIFELAKRMAGINIVISYKPEGKLASQGTIPTYHLAELNQSFSVGGITVHTIPAIQGGVSYLVEAGNLKIFYAGYHGCNQDSQTEEYRKQIDFLKPYEPIDIAILPVAGHISFNYESYLYMLDQLSPKAVYLMQGNYIPEEYPKCATVLQMHQVPVEYPDDEGDRFHYQRD
jgi:ankyrin repeat protein